MDLEKMQQIHVVYGRLIENEKRRDPKDPQPLNLLPAEREQILDQRKAKLVAELRELGVANIAPPTPPPPKLPSLGRSGEELERARTLLADDSDPAADARRVPA